MAPLRNGVGKLVLGSRPPSPTPIISSVFLFHKHMALCGVIYRFHLSEDCIVVTDAGSRSLTLIPMALWRVYIGVMFCFLVRR
jgi:hypothetical protein